MDLRVELDIESMRLDRFLREKFKGLVQSKIEQNIRKKLIKVNNTKAESSQRIKNGDIINLINFDFKVEPQLNHLVNDHIIKLANQIQNEYKIFGDQNLLIIKKPANLAVQGGSKIRLSINDALNYLNSGGSDYKIAHRLDKQTSGILIIAKNRSTAQILMQAFTEKKIVKTYLAILNGAPLNSQGVIKSYIAKVDSKNHQKVVESVNGKLAITNYKIIKRIKNNLTLVEFKPLTGRMHQIRVHAQSLGCPILGDGKYGKVSCEPYLYLHASEIKIPKEIFDIGYNFSCDLPEYFDIN